MSRHQRTWTLLSLGGGLAALAALSFGMGALAEEDPKAMPMAGPEAMAKGTATRKALLDHQKALRGDGVYSCCIRPGCAFCSTAADMCPCGGMLAKGGPVCPECWGGWIAGKGRLPGVEADKVRVIPRSKLKMMYDMKEKNIEKAAGTK